MMRLLICISFIIALISCGKQTFPDYTDDSDLQREEQEAGTYGATFKPLNPHKSGNFKGHAVLWIRGIQFYIRVILTSAQPRVRHLQAIHTSGRCPEKSDDKNGDNILDFTEVLAAAGPHLIPLDRSLKTQLHGSEWFPTTDGEGTMNYSRSIGVSQMMSDLRARDPVPGDYLAKLVAGENLDIGMRTIIIYGTSTDALLPIACGEIFEEFE